MKNILIVAALLISACSYGQSADSLVTGAKSDTLKITTSDTTTVTTRYIWYLPIADYAVPGYSYPAVYLVGGEFEGDLNSPYFIFNYSLLSASGERMYNGTIRIDGSRFMYMYTACVSPACRVPYLFRLIINQPILNIKLPE